MFEYLSVFFVVLVVAVVATSFDADTHTYRIGGLVVPNVSQVIVENGFVDFSHIPNGTLEAARARGRYVHACLHLYLEDDFDIADLDPRFEGYFFSALKYLGELGKKPLRNASGESISVEWRFWHTRRMYAGTLDYLGFDRDGALSIDDWKTGSPSDVSASVQLAAYEAGVRECLLPTMPDYKGPIRRRAVKLYADGSPARVELYSDPRDLALFFSALACTHYRRNHCRHQGVNL